MITLASTAFGLIAALAWNTAISDVIKTLLPAGKGIVPEFIYAVIVTLLAVIVMSSLGKLAVHQENLYGNGGGSTQGRSRGWPHQRGGLRSGHQGLVPNCGGRRRVLLYVLQGGCNDALAAR